MKKLMFLLGYFIGFLVDCLRLFYKFIKNLAKINKEMKGLNK